MSILMEALKKSEAQRQLGRAPTLDSPEVNGLSAGGERIWIPAVMLLLTLVIIGWIGSAQFKRPTGMIPESAAPTVVSEKDTIVNMPVTEGSEHSERSAKTPVMDYTTPAEEAVAARERRGVSRGAGARRLTGAGESSTPASETTVPAPTTGEALADVSENIPDAETSNKDAVANRSHKTDRLEPYVADSISYWQVPQSIRGELPELHISVLVYAEDPEDRFLLLNGQRVHEKQELENGMVLEEIQRDRAIFNYRNYRFYLRN